MFDIESIFLAQSVPMAIKALQEDPDALVIAGGTDVLIQIREGKLAGKRLVSINGIKELCGIEMGQKGDIIIRPLSTFAQVTESEIIKTHLPTLGFAADQAGGPQLRNTGTIGGNVCNGVTSADSASTLLTLNAKLEIMGPDGLRHVLQEDFYEGPGKVKLKHGELLTGICIAKEDYEGFYGCYIKYAMRNAMDIATLGCAVHLKLNPQKTAVEALRLAFGVAAPTPVRCRKTEKDAAGMPLGQKLLETVATGALAELKPRTSWRASKEFRQQLVAELSQRALCDAIKKAGGVLQ